jgi:Cys-tRNA synthase (O-phospho-L-seryl-tRNA:Cys-tRNA synthase)
MLFELVIDGIIVGTLPNREREYKEGDIVFIMYGEHSGTFTIRSINEKGSIHVATVTGHQKPQYQVCAEVYHHMIKEEVAV